MKNNIPGIQPVRITGKEIERLAEMLGDGRSFELVEETTNNGMINALRFEFDTR
jgi:hypothetical protein